MRWLAFFLVSLGACDCGGGSGAPDGGLDDECADSRNCPFGFACVDGRCELPTGRDGGGARDAAGRDGSAPTDGATEPDGALLDATRPDGGSVSEREFDYGVMRGDEVLVFRVLVNELDSPDDVPVFLYLPAAGEPYDSPMAREWLRTMAEAGYLAASAAYDDSPISNCAQLDNKAREIFAGSGAITGGLLFDLCDMVGTVCDRGVAIVGHGQGGQIAMRARDHDARIRAVLATGVGYVMDGGRANLQSCLVTGRSLGNDSLRIVNGASDGTYGPFDRFGTPTPTLRAQMDAMTGSSCGLATQCLRADGSGWVRVSDAAVSDGMADHCFHSEGGCGGTPDPNFLSTSDAWGLAAGRDWLRSRTPF